jgi:hypothetical protein
LVKIKLFGILFWFLNLGEINEKNYKIYNIPRRDMRKEKTFSKSAISGDSTSHSKNPYITKEENEKCLKMLRDLENDKHSYEFLKPVDFIGYGLTDYLDVIKKPMDLSSVRSNLKHKYKSIVDFRDDLHLIWKNCKTYNIEGSVKLFLTFLGYLCTSRAYGKEN